MNREFIIIIGCIIFVGFFYVQSDETSTSYSVEREKQPVSMQSDINDTTKTTVPDSLGR